MKITKMGEYAILGLVCVSLQEGRNVLIQEVSEELGLPKKFMSKIFQKLAKEGILKSYKEKVGGFWLNVPPGDVTLRGIIQAVQGPSLIFWCAATEAKCRQYPLCPMEDVFKKAQEMLDEYFENITLEEFAAKAQF